MSDYFKAYRARLERVDKYFRDLADELNKEGCHLYKSRSEGLMTLLIIYSEDYTKCMSLSFNEVPYRYEAHGELVPSKKRGSGYKVATFNSEDPPNCTTVLENLGKCPNPYKDLKSRIKNFWIPCHPNTEENEAI